jgi:hypothetical protein
MRMRPTIRGVRSVLLALALTGLGDGLAHSRAGETPAEAAAFAARTAQTPMDLLAAALSQAARDLDPRVIDLALQAQAAAVRDSLVSDPTTLTVIDYSRPSDEPRFFVFDLIARRLIFEELVAHGRNSGENMATAFSNVESSLKTSLGLFVTLDTYVGDHGVSLRLEGLEPGFNDRANARAIVIHGADYVNLGLVARYGRIGRSWGCPALPMEDAARVIARIRGGSAVFAYFPDARWLAASRFLDADSTRA